MNEAEARKILGDAVRENGALGDTGEVYIDWHPTWTSLGTALVDGWATADQLEAIAWWMRNTQPKGAKS